MKNEQNKREIPYEKNLSRVDRKRMGITNRRSNPHPEMQAHIRAMAGTIDGYSMGRISGYGGVVMSHTKPVVTSKRGKASRIPTKLVLKPDARREVNKFFKDNNAKKLSIIGQAQPNETYTIKKGDPSREIKYITFTFTASMFVRVAASH